MKKNPCRRHRDNQKMRKSSMQKKSAPLDSRDTKPLKSSDIISNRSSRRVYSPKTVHMFEKRRIHELIRMCGCKVLPKDKLTGRERERRKWNNERRRRQRNATMRWES